MGSRGDQNSLVPAGMGLSVLPDTPRRRADSLLGMEVPLAGRVVEAEASGRPLPQFSDARAHMKWLTPTPASAVHDAQRFLPAKMQSGRTFLHGVHDYHAAAAAAEAVRRTFRSPLPPRTVALPPVDAPSSHAAASTAGGAVAFIPRSLHPSREVVTSMGRAVHPLELREVRALTLALVEAIIDGRMVSEPRGEGGREGGRKFASE